MIKINTSKFSVFLLAISFLFCPRDFPISGLHSYRLVLMLILLLNIKKIRIDKKLFNIFTVLYILYISLSYFWGDGITSFAGFVIDTAGLILSIYVTLDSNRKVKLFAKYLCYCAIIYSILCVAESLTGFSIFNIITGTGLSKKRYGFYRARGVANHSINNGLILAILVCILLYFKEENLFAKKKLNIAIILSSIACIFTFSRTPLIALILVLFLYFVKQGGLKYLIKHKNTVLLCAIISFSAVIASSTLRVFLQNFFNMFLAVFDGSVADSITSSFGSNANGIGERFDLYKWIYQDMGDNHIFGVGANTAFAHDFQMTKKTVRTKTSIENQYLKYFYYFGYVGLSIFVLYVLKNMIYAIRRIRKNSIYAYALISMITLVVCWFFVSSVDDFRWFVLFTSLMYIIPKIERGGMEV